MNAPSVPKNWKALALDALRVTVYAGAAALAQWVLKALANGGWLVAGVAVGGTLLVSGAFSGGGDNATVSRAPGVLAPTVCPVGWVQTSGIDPQLVPAGGRPTTFYVCERSGTSVTVWADGHYSGFVSSGRALTDAEAREALK